MTGWQIYWLTRLDNVGVSLCICFLFAVIFTAICGIGWGIHMSEGHSEDSSDWKKAQKLKVFFFRGLTVVGCLLAIGTIIPSSKEVAAIILIPKLTNAVSQNEKLMNLPNNVLDLADQWIEELKPKNSEEK